MASAGTCLLISVISAAAAAALSPPTESIQARLVDDQTSRNGQHSILVGKGLNFTCTARGAAGGWPVTGSWPEVGWQKDGMDLPPDTYITHPSKRLQVLVSHDDSETTSTLAIDPVIAEDDQSVYGCYIRRAAPPNNRVRQFSIDVLFPQGTSSRSKRLISYGPDFIKQPSVKVTRPGKQSVDINCQYRSNGVNVSRIEWVYRDKVRARTADPRPAASDDRLKVIDQTLTIHPVRLEDVGTWTCRLYYLDSASSLKSVDYTVNLYHIPKLLSSSPSGRSAMTRAGDSFTATCTAEAIPAADVHWYYYYSNPRYTNESGKIIAPSGAVRGGVMLGRASDGRFQVDTDKSRMSTRLTIRPLRTDDQMFYSCSFRTSAGQSGSLFFLAVQGEYSWLYPLIAIVVQIVILVGMIAGAEVMEQRRELARRKSMLYLPVSRMPDGHLSSTPTVHSSRTASPPLIYPSMSGYRFSPYLTPMNPGVSPPLSCSRPQLAPGSGESSPVWSYNPYGGHVMTSPPLSPGGSGTPSLASGHYMLA